MLSSESQTNHGPTSMDRTSESPRRYDCAFQVLKLGCSCSGVSPQPDQGIIDRKGLSLAVSSDSGAPIAGRAMHKWHAVPLPCFTGRLGSVEFRASIYSRTRTQGPPNSSAGRLWKSSGCGSGVSLQSDTGGTHRKMRSVAASSDSGAFVASPTLHEWHSVPLPRCTGRIGSVECRVSNQPRTSINGSGLRVIQGSTACLAPGPIRHYERRSKGAHARTVIRAKPCHAVQL